MISTITPVLIVGITRLDKNTKALRDKLLSYIFRMNYGCWNTNWVISQTCQICVCPVWRLAL